jgi:hypothetical protein
MRAEKNFAEAFAGEKAGRGALEFHFFEFLAALAFELVFGERCFAREFVHQLKKRLGEFAEAGEADGAGVLSGAAAEVGAEAAEVLFDLATGAFGGTSAHERGGHFSKTRRAIGNERIAGPEIEFPVKFGNGMRFGENDFEAVGEARASGFGPGDGALGGERGDGGRNFRGAGSHYAASFLPASAGKPAFTGARKTMARFSGRRYFFATR